MVNFRTLAAFAYAAQYGALGASAGNGRSWLLDLVPKREVLYVGGRYTNITVGLEPITSAPISI